MTSDDNPNQFSTSKIDDVEHLLLTHVQQIVNELNRGRTSSQLVRLDSQLERELALDSLGRAELISRLEHAFDVRLPDQILSTAETPRDLLGALQRSDLPRFGAKTFSTSQIYHDGIDVNIPVQARTLTDVLAWHASTHPERPHVHLHTDDDQVEVITYASLYNKSLKIAAGLQEMDLKPGQTVAMMLFLRNSVCRWRSCAYLSSDPTVATAGSFEAPGWDFEQRAKPCSDYHPRSTQVSIFSQSASL